MIDIIMFFSETEKNKIKDEIQAISSKTAQEQYIIRLKQIIHEIRERTGQDLSDVFLKKMKPK